MLTDAKAYNGFAVQDLKEARDFYAQTLGLQISGEGDLMWLDLGDHGTLVYQQPDSTPASYTILNFEVQDIDEAVDELAARGVQFEPYEAFEQDEKGIFRGEGPVIAWFKDPSGNVLSVIEAG